MNDSLTEPNEVSIPLIDRTQVQINMQGTGKDDRIDKLIEFYSNNEQHTNKVTDTNSRNNTMSTQKTED